MAFLKLNECGGIRADRSAAPPGRSIGEHHEQDHHTDRGGRAYRRKMVVFEAEGERSPFQAALDRALGRGASGTAGGVRVTEIVEDPSDFKLVYDPEHPDANAEGYVEMPNVDLMQEMADAMAASQAYSANVTAFNVLKQVAAKGLEIGK